MTVCTTVTVPLRLKRSERRHLSTMIAEQRQAYNFGVAATLAALERDHKTGSRFDVWRTLTEARRSGLVASDVPVACQRAGVSAGRDAVKLWQETTKTNMNKAGYWAARRDLRRTRNADTAQLAELTDKHGAMPQDAATVELMDRLRVRIADAKEAAAAAGVEHRKTDPAEEQKRCDTKLSAASRRCSKHLASGTRRLFRTRKELERDPRRLPALTYQEGAILGAGMVRLPGKVALRLLDPNWTLPDRTRWTGAVQIVDITTRVTSATKAEHRNYELHAQLVLDVPDPVEPTSADQIVGVDAGVAIAVAVSDGREFHMPDETDITAQIKQVQRSRARCTYRSRQWNRRSDRVGRLCSRRTHARDDASRHIAKHVAATPAVRAVGAEITNNKAMTASAAGTAEHPGVNVAAKAGLNRVLHSSRFAGIRTDLSRACAKASKLYVPVAAAGTSSMCHRCGAKGIRESQAVFRCPSCEWDGGADLNAACNVKQRTWAHFQTEQVRKVRRPGRSSSDGRTGRNLSRVARGGVSGAISTKCEPNSGHHRI